MFSASSFIFGQYFQCTYCKGICVFEIKEKTGATSGNLSVLIDKLKQAEYLSVIKSFKNNYPLTVCKITPKGRNAFEKYVKDLKSYLKV